MHRNGWRMLLTDLGINERALLNRAGLPSDIFARDPSKLDASDYFRLWTALQAATSQGSLPLPLQIAGAVSAEWLDPTAVAALFSADLDSALPRLARLKQLCAPVKLQVDSDATSTTVTVKSLDDLLVPPAALVASELVFLVELARLATRTPIRPLEVTLPPGLGQSDAYSAYFGVAPKEGAIHTVIFGRDATRAPFLTADEVMWSLLEPELNRRLRDAQGDASVFMQVRNVLRELLPHGESSITAVSQQLGVSSRTLQRRLQVERKNFQQTLDIVRTELALHYLRNSTMSGSAIGLKLSFSDPNSFVRAVQSWTGSTPKRMRIEQWKGR